MTWEQHQPSCTGPPGHLSLQLKVCSAGLLVRPLYICAAGSSSENSCKYALYRLLKCSYTFSLLYITLNDYQMLLKQSSFVKIKTKSQVNATFNLKANFRFFKIFIMVKLLFSIFIKSSIAQTSLGHTRKKEAFRENGYGWILPCFL